MSSADIIAVDPDIGGSSDSDYVSGADYSTQSLTSSIFEYRYENGRRYHAKAGGQYRPNDEGYLLPNDESEQERLDIVHHIYLLVLNDELHLAPIGPNPQKILDVGTGTGIWAIDAAERYPSAKVIGTDITPIQPSWVPPNLEFHIDDAELDWTFEKNSFDLIHMRHLGGGIQDWEHLLKEAYIHCKPGGYVHMAEYEMSIESDDGTCHEDLALWKFYDLVSKSSIKSGRDFTMAKKLKPSMEAAGFINVQDQGIKIPLGMWPADRKQKEIGAYVLLSAKTGFEAFGIKLFTSVLGMSPEEATEFIAECNRNAADRKIHGYTVHHFCYGQKPLDAGTST